MRKLLIHTYEQENKEIRKMDEYKFIAVWASIVLSGFLFIYLISGLFVSKAHADSNVDFTVCMSACMSNHPNGNDYWCRQVCSR